jgi:hypothetical protein
LIMTALHELQDVDAKLLEQPGVTLTVILQ